MEADAQVLFCAVPLLLLLRGSQAVAAAQVHFLEPGASLAGRRGFGPGPEKGHGSLTG